MTSRWEITCRSIRQFFSTFIQMPSLKFFARRKGEDLTWKVPFTAFLKPEAEEKEVKESVEKRKIKRREVAEKNKL